MLQQIICRLDSSDETVAAFVRSLFGTPCRHVFTALEQGYLENVCTKPVRGSGCGGTQRGLYAKVETLLRYFSPLSNLNTVNCDHIICGETKSQSPCVSEAHFHALRPLSTTRKYWSISTFNVPLFCNEHILCQITKRRKFALIPTSPTFHLAFVSCAPITRHDIALL